MEDSEDSKEVFLLYHISLLLFMSCLFHFHYAPKGHQFIVMIQQVTHGALTHTDSFARRFGQYTDDTQVSLAIAKTIVGEGLEQ